MASLSLYSAWSSGPIPSGNCGIRGAVNASETAVQLRGSVTCLDPVRFSKGRWHESDETTNHSVTRTIGHAC